MGAEGPHADYKTARMALSLKGFSVGLCKTPHSKGQNRTHSWPGMGEIGSQGLEHRSCPSDIHLSLAKKSALSERHFRSNEE
ncbi:hypothetical protein AVEN_217559-1 [Araneus ventricosus]|uniref:Uncharacterized protein n=1 Tax=Araneus ventricosus TaxID=182803 RepID=A0A4Y2JLI3_ARAVE|nr:hypothetical protein AVEN_217559-1 [Araneus ventricosus]